MSWDADILIRLPIQVISQILDTGNTPVILESQISPWNTNNVMALSFISFLFLLIWWL